jgi:hypothetical protein
MDHGMSTAVECTMCDGERGGWIEHARDTSAGRGRGSDCTRCEGTGVEPFDVAALTDAELVAHVEAADIEGHIETDCHASYGSSQPGTVYVMEDGTVSGDWGEDVVASLGVWVHTVDVDTTTVEITDSIERFT